MAGALVNTAKLAYRPVATLLGTAAGAVASSAVDRVWRRASGTGSVPHAIDQDRGMGEILAAAALQGVVFAMVKALVERASATGVRRLTGRWPA